MKTCPLGHTCDQCLWHTHIIGLSPQTGQPVDDFKCAIAWLPLLLVENSQRQYQTAAAVESFRNEMVKSNDVLATLLIEAPEQARSLTHDPE
jgi:hypothetical protein